MTSMKSLLEVNGGCNIDPDGVELNSQTQNIKIKADGSTVVNVSTIEKLSQLNSMNTNE